jgi:hypothetical protein
MATTHLNYGSLTYCGIGYSPDVVDSLADADCGQCIALFGLSLTDWERELVDGPVVHHAPDFGASCGARFPITATKRHTQVTCPDCTALLTHPSNR